MNKLITSIKTKHVNYEVLTAAVLHLSEAEQVKVNNLITRSLGLPTHATADSIQRERQIKVDECAEYDGILDAFILLKRVTEQFKGYNNEALADAQMLIASIQDDR